MESNTVNKNKKLYNFEVVESDGTPDPQQLISTPQAQRST